MSEVADNDNKTEDATEKKIQDALDKGNVPFSKEAAVLASMLGILIVLTMYAAGAARRLTLSLSRFIENPGAWSFTQAEDASTLLYALGTEVGTLLAPVAFALFAAGLSGSLLQNWPSLNIERIRPKLSKLSLRQGWKRLLGRQGQVEFAKSVFKFAVVGIVAFFMLRALLNVIITATYQDPYQLPASVLALSGQLLAAICVATIMLAAADIIWSRRHWRHNLKMSRQEVKDEHKQIDGDPLVKARMRSLAYDRQRKRMISRVPLATLVITNPTHYAVALRYDRDIDPAPVVVAKGQDLIALKIREVANDNNVPVVEDKPLARSMYRLVEVDQAIPPEFYKAVAALIVYLKQKQSDRPTSSLRE